MGRKEFEVNCIGSCQVGIVICGWIAAVFDEKCFEAQGGFVFPPVVNESEDGHALGPE